MALNALAWRNDVNDASSAMGKGTTEKIVKVPGRNRTHELCNAI